MMQLVYLMLVQALLAALFGWLCCLAMHPVRVYLRLRRLRIFYKRKRARGAKVLPITRSGRLQTRAGSTTL